MLLGVRAAPGATSSCAPGTGCGSTSRSGRTGAEYSIRRLQENPKLAGYVAADTPAALQDPDR